MRQISQAGSGLGQDQGQAIKIRVMRLNMNRVDNRVEAGEAQLCIMFRMILSHSYIITDQYLIPAARSQRCLVLGVLIAARQLRVSEADVWGRVSMGSVANQGKAGQAGYRRETHPVPAVRWRRCLHTRRPRRRSTAPRPATSPAAPRPAAPPRRRALPDWWSPACTTAAGTSHVLVHH